jgi:membrane fusion protein
LIACLAFGQYTQRARIQGVLVPSAGLIKLSAPQEGRVTALRVVEGQTVEKGQELYLLDLDHRTSAGATSEAVVIALQTQRNELQKELLRRTVFDRERQTMLQTKLNNLAAEMAQVDRQIETGAEYVAVLEKELQDYEGFLARRIAVQRDVSDRRSRLMNERAQLEQIRRDRLRLAADRDEAQAEVGQIDREGASKLSEIRRQIADLERSLAEAAARREVQVVAPEAGRVTGVVAQAGQAVAAGAPLLTIVPASGTLHAHLYAQSSAIGFVREGARVMLRYRAYPYQKFGQYPGVITAISRAALNADEIEAGVPVPPEQERRGTFYRLTVRPERASINAYGKEEPLQVGMQVEADVFLDTRPLWQWILHPLLSMRSLRGPSGPAGP